MKRILIILTGIVLPFIFFSCAKEDVSTMTEAETNMYVNNWISETMQTYYYWETKIPTATDKTLSPDTYFNSLIYRFNKLTAPDGDRFSWIQDNYVELLSSLDGVNSYEVGFDYVLYLKEAGSNDVVGQITYVKKGTPAEKIGVKRGMMFEKINGTTLTLSNYQSLLATTNAQISLGFLEENYDENNAFLGFISGETLTFNTVANYSENPVYLDSVYTYQNRKVGYLVYNFFANDGGSGNFEYDLKLNEVFGKFKTAAITDLVLDLRYNSGGISTSAELLASLIVPNLNKSNIYTYYEYNDILNTAYKNKYGPTVFNSYFTENVMNDTTKLEAVNNVGNGLGSRVIVLTGPYTASASEQVINGLKPYMDQVILIGDTTYGKNVASFSLYEENDQNNKWGLQPIVAKYFNKDGQSDFTAGFVPDYRVDDIGMPGIKPLGDVNENLLNQAFVTLGIFNKPSAVPLRSRIIQNNRILSVSTHPIRGLQLKKMSVIP